VPRAEMSHGIGMSARHLDSLNSTLTFTDVTLKSRLGNGQTGQLGTAHADRLLINVSLAEIGPTGHWGQYSVQP